MSKAQWGSEYRTSSEQSAPSPPLIWQLKWVFLFPLIPHAGEASREIANLTERKNLHMPFNIQINCLTLDNNFYLGNLWSRKRSQKFQIEVKSLSDTKRWTDLGRLVAPS